MPQAAEHLDAARNDILAFTAFPREVWRQIWPDNPQERLNKEIRQRTDVVGIFPNCGSIIRLVGAVLAGQDDEWTESRHNMEPAILAACRKAAEKKEGGVTEATNEPELTIEAISLNRNRSCGGFSYTTSTDAALKCRRHTRRLLAQVPM